MKFPSVASICSWRKYKKENQQNPEIKGHSILLNYNRVGTEKRWLYFRER